MNKKLLAVAVASAFAAPAFAQTTTSNVILYGRLNLGLDNASATGAYYNGSTFGGLGTNRDWKSRMRVWDTGSRLGVRGSEDLGNGLRAIFQIESGLNANNGQSTSEANQYNTSAGTLASRPSWVGLEGGWGRVQVGRQDVYWGGGTLEQTGANYVNTDVPWFTNNSGRVSAGTARQSNVVSYTTPTFGGFNASFYYSPDANVSGGLTGSSQQTAGPGKNTNARLEATTLRWAGGPFQAQYDFVYKQNASDFANIQVVGFPLQNSQAKVWANKLLLGWQYIPGGQISLIGTYITNTGVTGVDITGAQTLHQGTAGVSWEHLLNGNILLLAQYGHQFNASGCDGLASPAASVIPGATNSNQVCHNSGANAYMLGVRYNLSKRTGVYTTFNHLQNQQNSFADYAGGSYSVSSNGGPPATPGTLAAPGASGPGAAGKGMTVQIFAVGIQHNF